MDIQLQGRLCVAIGGSLSGALPYVMRNLYAWSTAIVPTQFLLLSWHYTGRCQRLASVWHDLQGISASSHEVYGSSCVLLILVLREPGGCSAQLLRFVPLETRYFSGLILTSYGARQKLYLVNKSLSGCISSKLTLPSIPEGQPCQCRALGKHRCSPVGVRKPHKIWVSQFEGLSTL